MQVVFLCIEEVDWNAAYHYVITFMEVFLCIEEVDWNTIKRRYLTVKIVFLCIEEVDWNDISLNLFSSSDRSSSV